MPTFDELPFNKRPDLTPYLVHLTKHSRRKNGKSAYENLVSILRKGRIVGSRPTQSFLKGAKPAACFMDVPFAALKYVLTPENADPENPRYEPFGIIVTKSIAYDRGCRPVLYLSNKELSKLEVPFDEYWRIVRFEVTNESWISWLHEREWRCKGDFKLPRSLHAVLVRNTDDAKKLMKAIVKSPSKFKCVPKAVIPLTVLSQGLESSAIS